jgi:hypothetical protein
MPLQSRLDSMAMTRLSATRLLPASSSCTSSIVRADSRCWPARMTLAAHHFKRCAEHEAMTCAMMDLKKMGAYPSGTHDFCWPR